MSNYTLDITYKFYLKGLESFQFSPMDIPFTNAQIDCFRYDSLHSIQIPATSQTVHLMKRDITNEIKSWIQNTLKTLHLFVFYLQFNLITESNCMVDDNAMGRISSSDYLMQIPWGEIRYLLFVCWHRKYCISIEHHY